LRIHWDVESKGDQDSNFIKITYFKLKKTLLNIFLLKEKRERKEMFDDDENNSLHCNT